MYTYNIYRTTNQRAKLCIAISRNLPPLEYAASTSRRKSEFNCCEDFPLSPRLSTLHLIILVWQLHTQLTRNWYWFGKLYSLWVYLLSGTFSLFINLTLIIYAHPVIAQTKNFYRYRICLKVDRLITRSKEMRPDRISSKVLQKFKRFCIIIKI